MYNIVKSVIQGKNYELRDMLKKIDILWIKGNVTEQQRTELVKMAQGNAQTDNSVDLLKKLEELDKRVDILEELLLRSGEEETEESIDPVSYPEYEQNKWYYRGDMVSFEGAVYECIAPEGAVCVWSPSAYPTYWQKDSESTSSDLSENKSEVVEAVIEEPENVEETTEETI